MNAGAGADERATDVVDHAAQLRARAHVLDRAGRRWVVRAEGERSVAGRLQQLGHEWRVVHVRRPGRTGTHLDVVAVGPTGVWVVDAESWTGRVHLEDGVLHEGGRRREDSCEATARAGAAVAALLEPKHRPLVRSVVCLAGQGRELPVTVTRHRTTVVGLVHLLGVLSSGRERLSPAEVIAVHRYLALRLGGPVDPPVDPALPAPRETGSLSQPPPPHVRSRLLDAAVVLIAVWLLASNLPVWAPLLSGLLEAVSVTAVTPEPAVVEPSPAW